MLNYRGGPDPQRTVVTAAAARSSGNSALPFGGVAIDEQIAGFPVTGAAIGTKYAIAHSAGEFEVPFIAGAVKGDSVFIATATSVLTRATKGAAAGAGTQYFATVTAVPGDGPDSNPAKEPLAGFMWIELVPLGS